MTSPVFEHALVAVGHLHLPAYMQQHSGTPQGNYTDVMKDVRLNTKKYSFNWWHLCAVCMSGNC
jgi:hypothetical protein